MKSFTKITLIMIASATTNAAFADWYVSGNIGYNEVSSQESTGPNRFVDADYDGDISFGGALGYIFPSTGLGNFRTEVALSTSENDVDDLNFNNVPRNARGDITATSVLFNGYYDFTSLHNKFVPYVGVGIGVTEVDVDVQYGPANFNGDDTVLALQGIAGVTYKATDKLNLFTDIKYHVTDDPELNRFGGPAPAANVDLDSEYDSYSINFGVRYNF